MVAVTEVSFSVILRKTIDDADRLADDLYDPKIYENNVVTMCHYISGRALASGTFKAHDMATPAPCGQICFVAVGRKSDGASGAVVVASHVFYKLVPCLQSNRPSRSVFVSRQLCLCCLAATHLTFLSDTPKFAIKFSRATKSQSQRPFSHARATLITRCMQIQPPDNH